MKRDGSRVAVGGSPCSAPIAISGRTAMGVFECGDEAVVVRPREPRSRRRRRAPPPRPVGWVPVIRSQRLKSVRASAGSAAFDPPGRLSPQRFERACPCRAARHRRWRRHRGARRSRRHPHARRRTHRRARPCATAIADERAGSVAGCELRQLSRVAHLAIADVRKPRWTYASSSTAVLQTSSCRGSCCWDRRAPSAALDGMPVITTVFCSPSIDRPA